MKFETIYTNAREAVKRALSSLWTSQPGNESQEATAKAIREVVKTIFASDESMPIVQCTNSYEGVSKEEGPKAEALVSPLWDKISPQGEKHFFPFKHQYECWKTLLEDKIDGKPMSICVTTGTGSGKTECFMIPLVKDLIDQTSLSREKSVKAIFLYPLNALMEDQKERLENLLEGTDLTYTVYNGDLPEKTPKPDDHSKDAEILRQKIDEIRGIIVDPVSKKPILDKEGNKQYRFRKMVFTRENARKNPPDIILTNPTMLEYILLRRKDDSLISPLQKSLRWIAIDETHTYTGAGAAELSMLLRRVMMAFNVNPADIRFATSSATFANDDDPNAKAKNEDNLKRFIAGLTGLDNKQIRVVDGKRIGKIPEGIDYDRWKLIYDKDFVALDTLFPEGPVENKLHELDEMCSRLGNSMDMKIKVHYFFRVPNNGLYVRLTEHKDGTFKIFTRNEANVVKDEEAPLLELSRCCTCGEYSVIAKMDEKTGEYCAPLADDTDMFDLEEETSDSDKKTVIIGLTKEVDDTVENLQYCYINPTSTRHLAKGILSPGTWQLVANVNYCCPYCGTKQSRSSSNEDYDAYSDTDETKLRRFRVSADFISRIIAPVLLNEVSEFHPEAGNTEKILHRGQQYLSFADSRQMAAKSTLNQNLNQERLWFYHTIFNELNSRKNRESLVRKEIEKLDAELAEAKEYEDFEEQRRIEKEIESLKRSISDTITWREIAELFKRNEYCKVFCEQFLKKDHENGELDESNGIPDAVLENYIHSMMVMYLAGHPISAASPENMGLFHPVYPKLNRIKCCSAIERFNEAIDNPELRISEQDWKDLLRYFIDYNVRPNQAIYLKLSDENPINIKSTNRFMAEKPRRRPVIKPVMEKGKPSTARIVRFLAALYGEDKGISDNNLAQEKGFDVIKPVIDSLWETLTEGKGAILTHGSTWDEEKHSHVLDKDKDETGARRLNLTEMSFKLFEKAWLTDVNSEKNDRHTVALRPIAYTFKDFAPYLNDSQPMKLDRSLYEEWSPYPYYLGSGIEVSDKMLEEWASKYRALLWNNDIWGEGGIFSDRLHLIHLTPELFIQGEHTAQVDKSIARKRQQSFKNHGVNILACSTTMEMGVDLGSLELVMLSSVPPQPANYKQRAGRSGRNNRVKSACVTLCTSDAIGMRTYVDALYSIINRPVEVPTIDLRSPQVVERHINSFLVKYFGVFGDGNINQKVVNYYTPFEIRNKDGRIFVFNPLTNETMEANKELGNPSDTNYERFNSCCDNPDNPSSLKGQLKQLLRDTVFESVPMKDILDHAKCMNERCYAELSSRAQDLAFAFKHAGGNQKYLAYLNMKYVEMLNERLLNYWSTNRFTPNANMPVNVLELDLNASQKKNIFKVSTSTNPSYSLREAIAQYVPGNSIAVDGVVYVVRGLICSNMFERVKTFQKIYMNSDRVEIVTGDCTLPDPKKWSVNDEIAVELVRPVGFLPDVNESNSRILDSNEFTQVRAQLIGANDWDTEVIAEHLFTMRDNRESGDSKILYYNEGLGYGFAYCTRCGRTTIERQPAVNSAHPEIPPFEMNPIVGSNPDKPAYHKALSGKQWPNICSSRYDYSSIRRNIIIGDVIQTDYCEIKIRHKNMNGWINERSQEFNLLITLGIVFSQALCELLGKERKSVDFALTPNGHICIFDTNPGGAGYSNQLKNLPIMLKVIDKAYEILQVAKDKHSKDFLLDRYTLRYLRNIDIFAAIDWIEEEKEFQKL